jgi:Protein O-mannosyl-transferase TMEM260-like
MLFRDGLGLADEDGLSDRPISGMRRPYGIRDENERWDEKMRGLFRRYFAALTGLAVFAVYLITLAPSVVQIDSGELAAVQSTLGIAHPTGYPLFTLLGFLFSKLPLPFTKIFKANLLAAIFCSLGVVFLVRSSYLMFGHPQVKPQPKPAAKKSRDKKPLRPEAPWALDETARIISSVFSGLLAAFSLTFWRQSSSVEVYSLHILLISLIIYALFRAYFSAAAEKTKSPLKPWLVFSLCLALGFTNHMTTLLLIPGAALLFFSKEKFGEPSFRKISYSLPVFFGVLLVFYSYLPLRASHRPAINWGNPVNWENFWRHLTGRQYRVWLFSSSQSAREHLAYFIKNLPVEFAYIGLAAIVVGLFYSRKRWKRLSWFLILNLLLTVFYAINYDISDIDSYFILAYISLAFFSAFGFAWLFELLKPRLRAAPLSIPILALPVLLQLVINLPKADERKLYVYEDYTRAVMGSVAPESVIFSYQWDYFISASLYFQQVEGFRKDVAVIDKELLRRSWYFDQIQTNHPDVLAGIHKEIGQFQDALRPFERGRDYNSALLETGYQDIMTKLIATNSGRHDYYIGPELVENELRRGEFKLPEGYQAVPQLFLYKVTRGDAYVPCPDPEFSIRFPERLDEYTSFIRQIVARVLTDRTLYEIKFNQLDRARGLAEKLAKDFPEQPVPDQIKGLMAN